MAFQKYTPDTSSGHRRGPARVTFETAPNGRTTVRLSASARDWLSPGKTHDSRGREHPVMRVELLHDAETNRLLIRRLKNDAPEGGSVIDVKGLGQDQSAYFSGMRMAEDLGAVTGRYDCELVDGEISQGSAALMIDLGLPLDAATRQPSEEEQVRQIEEILAEGLDTVNGRPVRRQEEKGIPS